MSRQYWWACQQSICPKGRIGHCSAMWIVLSYKMIVKSKQYTLPECSKVLNHFPSCGGEALLSDIIKYSHTHGEDSHWYNSIGFCPSLQESWKHLAGLGAACLSAACRVDVPCHHSTSILSWTGNPSQSRILQKVNDKASLDDVVLYLTPIDLAISNRRASLSIEKSGEVQRQNAFSSWMSDWIMVSYSVSFVVY